MYVPPLDTESKPRPRLARTLDAVEIRVLGSLLEKQLSTPEYYPLTLNALSAAANQKSNRDPVTELGEDELERTLSRLQDEKLVWRVLGGRAVRFDHNLDNLWHVNRKEKALLTLLFLRGPQTAGELRARSDRLNQFESVGELEETLRDMAEQSEPLVRQLPRRPGQKEERWMHLAGGAAAVESIIAAAENEPLHAAPGEPLSHRVQRLEEQLAALASELQALKTRLGE